MLLCSICCLRQGDKGIAQLFCLLACELGGCVAAVAVDANPDTTLEWADVDVAVFSTSNLIFHVDSNLVDEAFSVA